MDSRIRKALKTSNALILGPLLAWLTARLLFHQPQVVTATEAFRYVQTFAVIFTMLCNYSAWWMFRRRLRVLKSLPGKEDRISAYLRATSARFILLEMALAGLVLAYFLTLHWSITALVWIQALLMFLQRPHPWVAAVQMGYSRQALFYPPDKES